MANCIYGLKIYLFRKSLKKREREIKKLERFAGFVVNIYIRYWFIAPKASAAMHSDLQFYQTILDYQDKDVSKAVVEKFLKHTWYC